MSVIATIGIGASDFVLGTTLADGPDVRVRLDRVVPVGGRPAPYLWVDTAHLDSVTAAFRNEADVVSFAVVDEGDDEALVRVEWARRAVDFLELLCDSDATLLEGVGGDGSWRLDIRFESEEDVAAFYRRCADRGIDVMVEGVDGVDGVGLSGGPGTDADLTATQRETLRLAHEWGYFEVPRRNNLVELAAELGVSDSAVSQRLRRGTGKLLAATFPEHGDR
jgi:predicted DNA binding protein